MTPRSRSSVVTLTVMRMIGLRGLCSGEHNSARNCGQRKTTVSPRMTFRVVEVVPFGSLKGGAAVDVGQFRHPIEHAGRDAVLGEAPRPVVLAAARGVHTAFAAQIEQI